jgi:hypothetical protein
MITPSVVRSLATVISFPRVLATVLYRDENSVQPEMKAYIMVAYAWPSVNTAFIKETNTCRNIGE